MYPGMDPRVPISYSTPNNTGFWNCTPASNGGVQSAGGSGWIKITWDDPVIPPQLSGTAPQGMVGMAYSFTPALAPANVGQPVTYSLVDFAAPPGLSLNAATGALSGTPTQAGLFFVKIKAANAGGESVLLVGINIRPFLIGAAVNGTCGAADGTAVSTRPAAGLCSAGLASSVSGNGPWSWSCNGINGGTTANCTAPAQQQVAGACGSAQGVATGTAPSNGLCAAGTASAVGSLGTSWSWTCSGAGGGQTAQCAAPLPTVNGACGPAHQSVVPTAPANGLCAAGTATAVGGTGPWSWACVGTGPAQQPASCMALPTPVRQVQVPAAVGAGNVDVSLGGGGATCGFDGTPTITAAVAGATPATPPGVSFPHGLLSYRTRLCTPGSEVTVTMKFPANLPAGTRYWKWGPTLADRTPQWYELPGATVAGNTVSFKVTDGGLGDDDGQANGAIVDPGGPGVRAAGGGGAVGGAVTPVPTLSEWGLMLLGLLAAGLGARRLRRTG